MRWPGALRSGLVNLHGPIPHAVGSMTELRTVWLDQNHLSGSIPFQIGSLLALRILSLHGNQLSGSLTGAIGAILRWAETRVLKTDTRVSKRSF